MQEGISKASRRELVRAVRERYRSSSRPDKHRILDEFVAVTGWHRKHAIRELGRRNEPPPQRAASRRIYDQALRQALLTLWEASDRICGKRLKSLLPTLVAALERHGHLSLAPELRKQLETVSSATIDRLLAEPRALARGRVPRRTPNRIAVKSQIRIRTSADWPDPLPGSMEADLVCHCGSTMEGAFVSTLVLTDIASGWTECLPLVARDSWVIIEALERGREAMPFPLRCLDTDNGSEFINEALIHFCATNGIELTRSRPYRKNDQAYVEQKNGAIVRRLVGYGRLGGIAAAEALATLYTASRLFVNFFQPSFKLREKQRLGARVIKRYHQPESPCSRLLNASSVAAATKARLQSVQEQLDPLSLLEAIRTAQQRIASMIAGQQTARPRAAEPNLDQFLASLGCAWQTGEVRPTHAREPRPERRWRTRPDPLDGVWDLIEGWLEAEPDRTAVELLARLHELDPMRVRPELLRTLQRRVRTWRQVAARRLVFGGNILPVT